MVYSCNGIGTRELGNGRREGRERGEFRGREGKAAGCLQSTKIKATETLRWMELALDGAGEWTMVKFERNRTVRAEAKIKRA